MADQNLFISDNPTHLLQDALNNYPYDRLFILTDEHTKKDCLPLLKQLSQVVSAHVMTIPPGDRHKNLDSLSTVWTTLSNQGASRHSLLLNIGGGMVTDLGGFAAATFKRGMSVINIPTTLLAMVDASIGGKTGINFNGLKNEIGAFHSPVRVLISPIFLKTLDDANFFSGYAEMLKHGLISTTDHLQKLLALTYPLESTITLKDLIQTSINVKAKIVQQDPQEHGIRKALNLGHTIGHAFESLSMTTNHPLLHGEAVACGLICELYLSHQHCHFPTSTLRQVVNFVKENYPLFPFTCKQYDTLYENMLHDKKNLSGIIRFVLLEDVGKVCIDQTVSMEQIFESFDFYRECMGL